MADVDMSYASDASFVVNDDSEDDFIASDDDFEVVENVAPKSKAKSTKAKAAPKKAAAAKKKAPAKKKAALDSLTNLDSDDDDMSIEDVAAPTKTKKSSSSADKEKSIEQIYQKKTQLEHILLRPDTYIGSTEPTTQPMFVLNSDTGRIVERTVTYTPGLYKIFDEILVNAADNKQRDPNMDRMDVTINPEDNTISVKNNGKGIPVEKHKEHKVYVPTLIFGELLTGSNFDDNEEKTTGGRNGYGAKLANIFSKKFVVECLDSKQGLKFVQTFRDNKGVVEDPIVKACTAKEKKGGDYTKITFCPDLARFKMASLDKDAVDLLSKRAYDIAGSMASRHGKKLSVTLNGDKVPVKDFKSYLDLYDGIEKPVAYAKVDERWEVGVAPSNGSFQQVSFVNAICTSKGGEHVQYIADQVAKNLKDVVKKKNKGTEVKPNQIKNQMCVFVNALINNPSFDSQTKEFLTTKKKVFGSKCELDKKFMKSIEKSDVVENCLAFAKFQEKKAMKRVGGTKKAKVTGISKLDDANFAGGPKAKDCTLIITEGDSAKSLAMSGLSVVGRDYYGVFPLKGKPLNVRDAKTSQVLNNEEIKNIIEIMGLKPGEEYDETSVKKLRYGHLMIMADQDHDGSHIKGLVINFLHHFWPSLLNVPGFLQQFITPIIKASKGKKSKTFFTLPEYEAWKESTGNDAKGWKIKYYKGLGTSTSAEAKEYFGNLDMHEVHFGKLEDDVDVEVIDDDDGDEDDDVDMLEFDGSESSGKKPTKKTSGGELIEMAFSKSKVEDRKEWLGTFQKDTYLNYAEAQKQGVRFSDFINKELILFSNADNGRSIPHVLDGFKPSQRKILFACFKRKLKGEIKVAQLAGYVSEHSAYHHGEASLQGAIVGMAQTFVGSNNINLLTPSGQFGTRRMGGKDSASPRYIFTKLEKITRAIFHPDDDALLNYLNDDGISIEPENYMPVIPMVLVNGSDGIGTGWSSSTPNYCPRQIIANLRRRLKGEELEKMTPHYSGFTGEMIAETGKREGSFIVRGKIERINDTTLKITELPIKKWTQDYKMFLEGLMLGDTSSKTTAKKGKKGDDEEEDADGAGKKKAKAAIAIQDFKENHTDSTVSFTITASKDAIDSYENEKDGLVGKFKLKTTISTSNMQLFNEQGRIIKYNTPEDILEEFYRVRLDFYEKRKAHLLEILRRERLMLSNKARFVEEVCSGDLVVSNRKRSELLDELQERGYDLMTKDDEKKSNDDADGSDDEDEAEDNTSYADLAKGYEYLLGMKIWTLTFEKSEKLRTELEEKTQEVADLEATQPSTLWWHDLDAIEDALDERDEEMAAAAAEEKRQQAKNKKTQAKKASKKTKGKGRKKKADEWDSDMESDEEEEENFSDSDDELFGARKKKASTKASAKSGASSRKAREAPPAFAAPPNARFSPKKAAMSKKAAPAAAKPVAAATTKKTATAASKKVEAKPVPAPAPAQEPVDEDGFESDASDESSVGLAAKLKGKLMVSPPPKSIKVDTASDIDSDDDDDDEDFSASSGSKRPSPKNSEGTPSTKEKNAKKPKKAATATKAAAKKKPAAKKPAGKKKAVPAKKKKTTTVCDLSDSEMSFACDGDSSDDDSAAEDEVVEVAPRARSRRAGAVRKTYTFSDSEDEESDFSFQD